MIKHVAYVLIVVSLLLSPVVAGVGGMACLTKAAAVSIKVDQGKPNDGHSKLALAHACCAAHVHHSYSSPANDFVPALLVANLRPSLLADQFPVSFRPDPLIEPPTDA